HRALRPVQPRPPHVAPGDDEGTRRAVPARPLTLASFSDFPFPAVPSDMTDSSSPPPEPPNKPPVAPRRIPRSEVAAPEPEGRDKPHVGQRVMEQRPHERKPTEAAAARGKKPDLRDLPPPRRATP